jgi:hypothetical protein
VPIPIPGGFADVEDAFAPLPPGTYSAVVFKGELKEAGENAKNPGSQYIAWEFNILDDGYEKRKAWMNTSLVSNALPMLKRFLLAVGYDEEELNNPEFGIDIDEVVARECRLVIVESINPNTDEKTHSVKRILPSGAVAADLP